MRRIGRIEGRRPVLDVRLAVLVAATVGALVFRRDTTFSYFAVLVAIAAFWMLLVRELRAPRLTPRVIAVVTAGLLVAAVASPMRQSKDVWAYSAYGEMVATYHVSPYTHSPREVLSGTVLERVNPRWRGSNSVYGPLFTGISALGIEIFGATSEPARAYFQGLAALALAGVLVLLWRRTRNPVVLVAIGLNPVVIASGVNGGHVDVMVALPVLAAVLLAERERFAWAGLSVGVGALLKVIALAPAAGLLVWVALHRGRRQAAALATAALAVMLAGFGLAGGLTALAPLRQTAKLGNYQAMWRGYVPPTALGIGVVGIVVLALLAARARDREPAGPATATGLGTLLAAPYVLPWYSTVVLPVAVLKLRSKLTLLALVHASVLLPGYFPLGGRAYPARVVRGWFTSALPFATAAAVLALVVISIAEVRRRARSSEPGVPASTPTEGPRTPERTASR